MSRIEIVNRILSEKLVAIVRMRSATVVPAVIEALIEGGIEILEITSNTPGYLKHIRNARVEHPDKLIGAGTVWNEVLAQESIEAGAQFLVTPNTIPEIVEIAHHAEIPVIMGAFTATEMLLARQSGGDIIKLFPASIAGIPYMKAVLAPLDDLKLFAVGGIHSGNALNWLQAGAAGVGVGSQLIGHRSDGSLDRLQTIDNAKALLAAIKGQ